MTIRGTITDSTPGIVAALLAALAARADTANPSSEGCSAPQTAAPAAAHVTAKRSPSACADCSLLPYHRKPQTYRKAFWLQPVRWVAGEEVDQGGDRL